MGNTGATGATGADATAVGLRPTAVVIEVQKALIGGAWSVVRANVPNPGSIIMSHDFNFNEWLFILPVGAFSPVSAIDAPNLRVMAQIEVLYQPTPTEVTPPMPEVSWSQALNYVMADGSGMCQFVYNPHASIYNHVFRLTPVWETVT